MGSGSTLPPRRHPEYLLRGGLGLLAASPALPAALCCWRPDIRHPHTYLAVPANSQRYSPCSWRIRDGRLLGVQLRLRPGARRKLARGRTIYVTEADLGTRCRGLPSGAAEPTARTGQRPHPAARRRRRAACQPEEALLETTRLQADLHGLGRSQHLLARSGSVFCASSVSCWRRTGWSAVTSPWIWGVPARLPESSCVLACMEHVGACAGELCLQLAPPRLLTLRQARET